MDAKTNLKLLSAEAVALIAVMALFLFVPAGTLNWPGAWAFLVMFGGGFVILSLWLLRHNPALLRERMSVIRADQKGWDKILMGALQVLIFVWLIVMAFDAQRFHWSQVPAWVQVIGAVLLVASLYVFYLTFKENSYLSTVVRIQKERGHEVISTGPYHIVRHPMYLGMILFFAGVPLLLGSWYGLLGGILLTAMIARRAILEEQTL